MSPRRDLLALLASPGRPWLVAGKGPSFDPAKAAGFRILALNHACDAVRANLAHFIDLEAFEAADPGGPVALPWRPNLRFRPATLALTPLAARSLALRAALAEGRVYAFNRREAGPPFSPLYPYSSAVYFSAESAFSLLAAAGLTEVYSMGVDGGTSYAPCFDVKDRLANGQASFDKQTPRLEAICREAGVRWTKV